MPEDKKQRVVIYTPEEILTLLCAIAKMDPMTARGAMQQDGSYAIIQNIKEGE